ncbi:tripartite tricarboxylate transporter TctB family protein [Yangia mangrovi]|uniref:Tripartite tricarboxylate transporter TctB family protein n=1 Tax=Alloyangia mangrovi TaxID=1779329 RepID=A0A2A3JZX8_9RHOB|nr:tripartite tricarboxylate transporter TctB family protein [Alloyangia mangrovi]MCA0941719.1 tripartite tricarboxylate transporter TctB family protein [Alloyangia pacifica]MCA0946903.1 tripartite tricarboxylate transporter TctB family protein [Alloyangia pacifica]MCT4371951.1 tripartite tricarboxylate transporter TctB family protein [Alloyangia mangrovi]
MSRIETEHHDGTSDATPGGYEGQRRPGELVFGAVMVIASLVLLWNAYGISGFEALSAPGSVPMATTAVMAVTALVIFLRDLRLPRVAGETVAKDILPGPVLVIALMLVAYGVLLKPLGFLPTSALFLIAALKMLARRGWLWTIGVSLGSLLLIWIIFRIVFTVLMPAGIVPEAEAIQAFRNLFAGGK